ncbi:hypothetical protein TPR58_04700 [Sphingomonas sp. HF-S3]|uniref:DUF4350 domain-containing protein n=1 Tax=Sphingomonas rustica TaxID=3103142 RepID=A0ABV0B7T4_9SPHN
MSATGDSAPFKGRTIAIVAIVSIVAFIAFMLLSAYEGDLRPQRGVGAHALSNSAVGFSGVIQLAQATGSTVRTSRDPRDVFSDGLLVVTPQFGMDPDELKRFVERRDGRQTLIILPKRIVLALPQRPGWVREAAVLQAGELNAMLKGVADVTVRDARGGRTIQGATLEPILNGPSGGALLAAVKGSGTYILADPDALNNMGLKTLAGAERARAILDEMEIAEEPILFDLTLVGRGEGPSLLKLAFEPPYLPFTLCLALATLLAALHASRRFGPALHEERKVAFGKRAIAENGVALLRLARRRHRTGARYVALTREAVASATGAPPGLNGAELDRYLDSLSREGEPFTSIAARAADAPDTRRLMAAVRDLYSWRRTVTRDHR